MFFKIVKYAYRTIRRPMGRFFLFAILCFVWLVYIISVQLEFENKHDDDNVRGEIARLSQEYARIIENMERRDARFVDYGQQDGENISYIFALHKIMRFFL